MFNNMGLKKLAMCNNVLLVVILLFIASALVVVEASVSYDSKAITINGRRRILISGSIHYPRSTPEMWPDLIERAKEGGLDVIQTYVFWNGHEPSQGKYYFEGNYDLVKFIKLVKQAGLYVHLRIGPYVCAEWNFGGFPVWLKYIPGIQFRTDNGPFKAEMQRFTTKIVNMMKAERLFESQGGPIILSQIENEYGPMEYQIGSPGKAYTNWAAKMAVGLGTGVPWVMCKQDDAPDPVINTCNGFYCDYFSPNKAYKPKMWTEAWTGWFTGFGSAVPHRPVEDLAFAVARFIQKGGSFINYYMYHGGTNFGRTAGGPFIATSYDYDAPLDEYVKHQNQTMSQEAENEGVQPNHNNSVTNRSLEEPICQLPYNSLGRGDFQSLEAFQIEYSESWTAEDLNYYRPLFNAAQKGDWNIAKSFIDNDPRALTATISFHLGTVLHIAAECCQWKFILKLLELDVSTPQSIATQNVIGNTVLHYVAEGGSLKTAKALVEKNPDLLQMVDIRKNLPLLNSIYSKSKDLVWYLSLKTRVESPSYPFFIPELPHILRTLILSDYPDIALYFVQKYPHLALATYGNGSSLLGWLVYNPSYFFSGSNLGFFQKWIYKFVRVEIQSAYSLALQSITQDTVHGWFKILLWKAITQLEPSIKIVRDAKMKHECSTELVKHVVNELSTMSYSQICNFLRNPISILGIAIEGGIEEIVQTLLGHFPDLMFLYVDPQRNILQVAIECRQETIVNIIKEISPTTTTYLCAAKMKNNSTLHLAGKLAPASKLFSVSGVALQMQRELQWFKEVEMYTHPAYRVWRNSEQQTAKDAFRIAHENLSKDGEKWMKDTANSCMLVSTLIATVLFATVFTVPGGYLNDKGIPIFLRSKAFTVFAISNALGLFSSLTSLLMFLAILTARYEMEDFLESLPKKLIIGLGSLFFAIAAMIIAFGAALTIILNKRWHWVSVPITLLASFPVAMFVMLQLPLFVQMVRSTYGASIFRPWPSRV